VKKTLIKLMLAITLIVHSQYFVDGKLFVDYSLNNDYYQGVYVEDMPDNFQAAINPVF
jgi:hypothetical protein